MPTLYTKVAARLRQFLQAANVLSFTTDTWTNKKTQSFMGISAHWIDEDMERCFAVLHCARFRGRHTAARLAGAFESMLSSWGINVTDAGRVHVVLRDNAANVKKAFADAGLPSLGCVLYTLQLCLNDCIFDQRVIADIIAVARKLVGHFKHSSANDRLHELLEELGLANLQPVQDVVTCWNSTFYMLKRLKELKTPIAVFCSEDECSKLDGKSMDCA